MVVRSAIVTPRHLQTLRIESYEGPACTDFQLSGLNCSVPDWIRAFNWEMEEAILEATQFTWATSCFYKINIFS